MPADCNTFPGQGEASGVLLSDPAGAHRVPFLTHVEVIFLLLIDNGNFLYLTMDVVRNYAVSQK